MGDSKVRTMRASSVNESLATSRRSGWFQFTDLDRTALVRRINAVYDSTVDIAVKLFSNGDSTNSIFSGTFRANNGSTGMTVDGDPTAFTASATTLETNGTNVLENGDWIKIDNEILKVITAGASSHTVQRGMRGTTGASHDNVVAISYANYPNDSLRVGKRAKYALVEVSTAAATTTSEISKMEIEYE